MADYSTERQVKFARDGALWLDDELVEMPEDVDDTYEYCLSLLAKEAAEAGEPVPVRSVDDRAGETRFFSVTDRGAVVPAGENEDLLNITFSPEPGAEGEEPEAGSADGGGVLEEPAERRTATRRERRELAEQENFLPATEKEEGGAWAKTLQVLTLGLVRSQPSEKELARQRVDARMRRRISGSRNTAVLSLKGGIGKTSTTVGVGHVLAECRGDQVCAIDANPDSGDLVERALGEAELARRNGKNISHVVKDAADITSLTRLLDYLELADRLYVLAGDEDPELSDSLNADEYRRVQELLSQYFAVTLTDCGTGVSHPAMRSVLERADNIVIAASYAISGAERARRVLTWLDDNGYGELADQAIIVITDKDTISDRVVREKIGKILKGLCRGLFVVPHDPAVADGDSVRVDQLQPATLDAYRDIAAAIIDGYPQSD